MNYTEIYNRIYKSLDKKNLNHDDKHSASLKITNAVWDLYINTSDNYPETFTTISHPVCKNQRFTLNFKALDSDWKRLWLICRALCLKGIDEISLLQR